MLKFLGKAGAFAAILLACFFFLGRAYEAAARKNLINVWNRRRFEELHALPPHFLDMVFIGSSHSYCSFDPEQIGALLGVESFQMGMPLQHPDSSYFTLLEVLKTQTPSIVIMELYWDMLDDDFDLKQADTLFQALDGGALKGDYIREVFPWNEKIKYAVPLIRYQQDFWTYQNKVLTDWLEKTLGVYKPDEGREGEERYGYRGFIYCDYLIPESKYGAANQFQRFDGKKWAFSAVQKEYLIKMISLCAENGARLLFVTAPVPPVSMEIIQNYGEVHQAVASFAVARQIPYLDFNLVNQEEQILTNDHFRDDAHLNYSGAVIVDRYLARWILENTDGFTLSVD
ncbi:MAG: hypothetical protein LBT44_00655 [Clostridiales bacterium]|jgi:hypothetical protein|nr:hypothetical protein [Clostridiales bacterium]